MCHVTEHSGQIQERTGREGCSIFITVGQLPLYNSANIITLACRDHSHILKMVLESWAKYWFNDMLETCNFHMELSLCSEYMAFIFQFSVGVSCRWTQTPGGVSRHYLRLSGAPLLGLVERGHLSLEGTSSSFRLGFTLWSGVIVNPFGLC